MAEAFLEDIYKKSILVDKIEEFVSHLYAESVMQIYYTETLNSIIPELTEVCKDLVKNNDIDGQTVWNILTKLSSYNSYVSVADEFESIILPVVKKYVKNLSGIDITDDDGIRLYSSSTGFLTAKDLNANILFHSDVDPMKEARNKAKTLYNIKKNEYVFFGCGLGYLPYQMYLISDKSVHMSVIFTNRKNYEYARLYGVLEWIPEENLEVYIENDIEEFLSLIKKYNAEYYIFRPELSALNPEISGLMNELISRQITLFNVKKYSDVNFYKNVNSVKKSVSEYKIRNNQGQFIVVAGGPSVDDNIGFIKEHSDMIIICVGTIYKRLLNEGIIPDIVTIMDPFPTTLPQVKDVRNNKTVLFTGIDTYWKTVDLFDGDRYLLAIDDDLERQKEFAEKYNQKLFPECTTVTVLAYNIAVYFNAKEIYLIGADFAYPNGKSHASGTAEASVRNTEGMLQIDDVNGDKVYTTEQMNSYRTELEKAINMANVKSYNLSNGGAKIKGSKKLT